MPSEQNSKRSLKTNGRFWVVIVFLALLILAAIISVIRISGWQDRSLNSRILTLVNPWNGLEDTDYTVHKTETEDGFFVDKACADALKTMLADCRGAGGDPKIVAAYRTIDEQLELYDGEIQRRIDGGMTPDEATASVSLEIAVPGRSEHELGLAVDLVDATSPMMDASQAGTPTQQWLMKNAWRYGFILRYPEGGEEITGFTYQPWHYRYVGEEVASRIFSLNVTLEEYLSLFYNEEATVVFEK